MTDVSESRMNVAALKRVDPYVKDILETATHVALYIFNDEINEWEKTDVEGALFVYSRNGEPYNSILIMNRLNTNNQVEPVTKGLDLQLQEPFLLYRNSKCNIYGIWFYDKEECVRIASMLNKLVKESENSSKNITKGKKNMQRTANNVDIFSMLSKAQEDFNTNRGSSGAATTSSNTVGSNERTKNSNNERFPGPLTAPLGPDVTSQSVMDFFAKAKVNTEQFQTRDKPTPGKVVANDDAKPILARLMSHPAAHTLEHIEKQQRSVTPQPSGGLGALNSTPIATSISNRSKKKNKMAITQGDTAMIPPVTSLPQDHPPPPPPPPPQPPLNSAHTDANGPSGFLRIQSPINMNSNRTNRCNSSSGINASNSIPLASLFAHTSDTNSISEDPIINTPINTRKNSTGTVTAPALIPPVMFAAPSPAEPLNNRPLEPLTRNQLLQAFNYLLRSDPEFVNKLHEAYVKSFGEILS